jgi:DNA-binding MurR/RpiR family transcriptional regulator
MDSKRDIAGSKKLAAHGRGNSALASSEFFTAIRGADASLSHSQKRVAKLLLEEPQWVVTASVAEIAARLKVSAPTIVRFARKVGYDGLRDLKLKLAGAMALRDQAVVSVAVPQSATDDVVRSVTGGLTTVLKSWERQVDPLALDGAASAIHRARQIICFGANAFSNLLAQKLQGELYRLGYSAHCLADLGYQLMATGTLTSKDVLVVISLVGQVPALLRAIDLARARGVFVVAITRSETALAEKSDIVLRVDVANDLVKLQGIDASVLQTVTVETLIVLVGLKQTPPAHLKQRSRETAQIASIYHED